MNTSNFKITPVSPTDAGVQKLVEKLNKYQIGLYGRVNCNLETPEELIKNDAYMLGGYSNEQLVAIGAVKIVDSYAEIKRMYVEKAFRQFGYAQNILLSLENYAYREGVPRVCLETGNKHHSAIRFYKNMGYSVIEKFGNYLPNPVSIYYEKKLPAHH